MTYTSHVTLHTSHVTRALIRVDFVKQYWNSVFSSFIEQYAAGLTPNPDILCNRFVKFGYLLQHAKALGADRLATGHYACVSQDGGSGGGGSGGSGGSSGGGGGGVPVRLLRPRDETKDQTYFLCQVPVCACAVTLAPLRARVRSAVVCLSFDVIYRHRCISCIRTLNNSWPQLDSLEQPYNTLFMSNKRPCAAPCSPWLTCRNLACANSRPK